jgi:NADPH:quinone reductase-like Zn-dependent oxidoreductase
MQAMFVNQPGGPEVLQVGEAKLPELGPDELLVRVLAAGVGPWDVDLRQGGWPGPWPYIPGAEFAGVVVGETGAWADFPDGAPVYGYPGLTGCYAQYVACHVERLAPIPAGLRLTDAAATPVDALTAEQGGTDFLSVSAGDEVLITAGASGLGHFAVRIACALGAIVVATAGPRDVEFVHHLGAPFVFDDTAANWPDEVRRVTGGGAGRVLACSARSFDGAVRAARPGATLATPLRADLPAVDSVHWRRYEGQPSGSRLIRMAPWFDDGVLSVDVTGRYYWQDAASAHRELERRPIRGELVLVVNADLAAALEI